MMGERKSPAITPQAAWALNNIDVVFADSRTIVDLWHTYYGFLCQPKPTQQQGHAWLALLSAMAHDLGYDDLQQIDLDKFYMPQGHFIN